MLGQYLPISSLGSFAYVSLAQLLFQALLPMRKGSHPPNCAFCPLAPGPWLPIEFRKQGAEGGNLDWEKRGEVILFPSLCQCGMEAAAAGQPGWPVVTAAATGASQGHPVGLLLVPESSWHWFREKLVSCDYLSLSNLILFSCSFSLSNILVTNFYNKFPLFQYLNHLFS